MNVEFDQSQDFDVGFETDEETAVTFEQGEDVGINFENAKYMDVEFTADEEFACSFDGGAPPEGYAGPYEVTPSENTQTLQTTDRLLTQNITVAPIPSNYGRITWDGTKITVS